MDGSGSCALTGVSLDGASRATLFMIEPPEAWGAAMTDIAVDTPRGRMIRVWDPVVRVGHWGLVAAFAVAWLTGEGPATLHDAAGYAVGGYVLFRLVWGVLGPRHARFADFVTGPGRVVGYLADMLSGHAKRFVGHSPAGGAMIVLLLLVLGATVWAGMVALAEERDAGPLAPFYAAASTRAVAATAQADDDRDAAERGESVTTELHETLADIALFLVILHVAGVALASRAHHENLVRAMVDGLKRP